MKYNLLFGKENLLYSALSHGMNEMRRPDGAGSDDTGGTGGTTEDPDETPKTEVPEG